MEGSSFCSEAHAKVYRKIYNKASNRQKKNLLKIIKLAQKSGTLQYNDHYKFTFLKSGSLDAILNTQGEPVNEEEFFLLNNALLKLQGKKIAEYNKAFCKECRKIYIKTHYAQTKCTSCGPLPFVMVSPTINTKHNFSFDGVYHKQIHTKNCDFDKCGRAFETKYLYRKYCSDKCKLRAAYYRNRAEAKRKKKPHLKCSRDRCSTLFYRSRTEYLYCSPECRSLAKEESYKICANPKCKGPIKEAGQKFYCSDRCRAFVRLSLEHTRRCKNPLCNKEITVDHYNRSYCSFECRVETKPYLKEFLKEFDLAKTCKNPNCKKKFVTDQRGKKYCSLICSFDLRRGDQNSSTNSPSNSKPLILTH